MPASWGGEWDITVTYRDATTMSVAAVDTISAAICEGEAAGVALFEGLVKCAGKASAEGLGLVCSAETGDEEFDDEDEDEDDEDTCSGGVTVEVAGTFDPATQALSGAGAWTSTAVGDCPPLVRSGGETITFAGVRRSTAQVACAEPPFSLAEKLLSHPSAIVLLGGGGGGDDDDEDE